MVCSSRMLVNDLLVIVSCSCLSINEPLVIVCSSCLSYSDRPVIVCSSCLFCRAFSFNFFCRWNHFDQNIFFSVTISIACGTSVFFFFCFVFFFLWRFSGERRKARVTHSALASASLKNAKKVKKNVCFAGYNNSNIYIHLVLYNSTQASKIKSHKKSYKIF